MNGLCEKQEGDTWHRRDCGDPFVEMVDGKQFCKKHAGSAKGVKTRREKRDTETSARLATVDDWLTRMDKAAAALVVKAKLHHSHSHGYEEAVVISLADFERLAGRGR